jgi:predicted secreted hydrolase
MNRLTGLLALLVVAAIATGCAGPILANPPAQRPAATGAPEPSAPLTADPQPVRLPADDAAHDRLTEWWYWTGHLEDEDGDRWGFEYVIFRAERGGFPVSWASHLALTDEGGDAFTYAQRSEIGPQVDRSAGGDWRFDLGITGFDPTRPETVGRAAWEMRGTGNVAELRATAAAEETAGDPREIGLVLDLRGGKEPALHDEDGWIDFGPAGSSYYYSRTSVPAAGTLTVDGRDLDVSGFAWFDHQWGDFISIGGGGWDWFAINLEDGTDITLSQIRDADGSYPLVYGTMVDSRGTTHHLERDDFTIEATQRWTSPETGATYPAAWHITLPGEQLVIDLVPSVADQELDTRASTGVVYWEGSQLVSARRILRRLGEVKLGGEAYVELTGYGPAGVGP